MTMSEFKMWLEGFEESIDGAPTKAQWKKITKKLEKVAEFSYPVGPVYPVQYYPDRWPWTYTTCRSASDTVTVENLAMNPGTSFIKSDGTRSMM